MSNTTDSLATDISLSRDTGHPGLRIPAEPPVVRIEGRHASIGLDWREMWRFRDLLLLLTERDVKVRYKQTALGAGWAILQPLMTMVVFSIFFGHLAGLGARTGGIAYPVYVFAALIPWTFFATAVTNCGNCLVGNYDLITKVYFPRLIMPMAIVLGGLVDLAFSVLVLFAIMWHYHVAVTLSLFMLPILLIGIVMTATGVGSLLAALSVAYRDFRYVVPFLIQIWMFVTPVIYPSSIVPERWRFVMALNPLAGQIEAFRAAILGRPIAWEQLGISAAISFLILVAGAAYFRSVERQFADVI